MPNYKNKAVPCTNGKTLQLREEKLDISKRRVQIGEVNIHKEVITEEKIIKIPVTREELVIESKVRDGDIETRRIPIMEEHFEVKKHPVVLEDVSYHIEQFQENKCITEVLKKEELKIDKSGSANIIDKEIKGPSDLT